MSLSMSLESLYDEIRRAAYDQFLSFRAVPKLLDLSEVGTPAGKVAERPEHPRFCRHQFLHAATQIRPGDQALLLSSRRLRQGSWVAQLLLNSCDCD